ncbi:hypothetical protein B0J13DRAFT_534153 [Dactylonectria estremocensis]|uniref:Uncharacterized protein n=1 Tax=Dactylonectria estremocensis TaxID=1079267 RepID=A0A9P9D448_9HYPO|nr:hypothetical protein B0J13DRAFT_534153 [Dactylonectria estremocensis]
MCTLNDISQKMISSDQLENNSSNDSPAHNNPNDKHDTWESPPELSLACATTHTKLAIIDVNRGGSWTEIESEESENEEFGDLERPQGHRKRRSQQPLFNDRPKRARHVTPEATPEKRGLRDGWELAPFACWQLCVGFSQNWKCK